jgi:uncharacterized protein (TIGR03067 family)
MGMILDREQVREGASHRDCKRLQGVWDFVTGRKEAQLLIASERFTMAFKSGEIYHGSFDLDPTCHPREMDMIVETGPNYVGQRALAIYEIDGDHLIWCSSNPGILTRPRIFSTDHAPDQLCLVFRRAAAHF